ncbi:TonB-dependent receptor [Parafrankia sp. BMG5.11]|uniref:TonB-dependent receptor n=1 Tax=Parafrankia sp. BMG5.11 TaxID=222540 RepID=UPI00103B179B|nr:TonB-dependent receptor [Parafrankia sp. BMG5.11]TCJ37062.1 TonB-dependent receptor [Parafrankia sp. BMG5.11]
MSKKFVTSSSALLCGVSFVTLPIAAAAQDAPNEQAVLDQSNENRAATGNEIIVTALRADQTLQDASATVDVVTAEDITDLNIFDVKDISSLAPGLTLTNNDGRSNVATLRGITFDPDAGTSPAVEIFMNEVPADPQTVFTALYDVEQIEILRGPQGLFRGRTSPAGAILIRTARPDMDEPAGHVQGTIADEGAYNFQGAASLPFVPGKIAMRAALLYDQNDVGSVTNVDGRNSYSETMSGRVSLAFDNEAGWRTDVMYYHLDNDTRPFVAVFGPSNQPAINLGDPSASGPAIAISNRLSVTEGPFRFQNNTDFVTINSSYDFGGVNLAFNGGYQDSVLSQLRDQDVANAVPNYTRNQQIDIIYQVLSAELRLGSNGDGPFNWTVSGNYTDQDNFIPLTQSNDSLFGILGFSPISPSLALFRTNVNLDLSIATKNYGLAGLVTYDFSQRLSVTAGIRHTWNNVTRVQNLEVLFPDGLDVGGGFLIFGLPPTTSTVDSNSKAFTGGASINYEVTPDLNIYASYGRAFRPGVFAVGTSVPLDAQILNTDDETSDGFEVGAKMRFLNGRGALNLSAYYQKFKNYIAYNPGIATDAQINATTAAGSDGIADTALQPLPFTGDAISKGVEAQFSLSPTDFIDFAINAAYSDAHYDDAEILCNDFDGNGQPDADGVPSVQAGKQISTCVSNDRLSQIPKFSLSSTAEVRIPTGGSIEPFVRGLLNYRPGFNSERDNFDYRSYTKLDLFAGIRGAGGRWELLAFVKNVFDKARVLSASQGIVTQGTSGLDFTFAPTNFTGEPFDSGYRTGVISPPRQIGVTAKFNW